MEKFLKYVELVNSKINDFAWGPVMLVLLVGTGVFLSSRTGFIQVRKFGYIMKNTLGSLFKKKDKKDHGDNLSPFQAVSTALAGTVGTGNIAGVTGAIFTGGVGAVFWMWVSAFFGMCTKYAEITLAIKYRETDEKGQNHGGPMYYITKGLGKNWKWLAVIFSVFGALASFGIGNMSQSNEISGAIVNLFGLNKVADKIAANGGVIGKINAVVGVDKLFVGIILAILVAIVIIGNVKRVGQVTSLLVPFMSAFYIICGIVLIAMRITDIPGVFGMIFKEAFSFKAAVGGAGGYVIAQAIRQGFARGVFSNEAGLGSAPIAHAASSTDEPCEQAMWGVFEVFIDTIIICTITAFAVILSGVYKVEGGLDMFSSKGAAAAEAFNSILPGTIGGKVIQISLLFFALSTILGWFYYGQTCLSYLTKQNKAVDSVYKVVFSLFCIVGSIGAGELMWNISDTFNGLMAIPNLIALLLLSSVVASETKRFFNKNKIAIK